MNIAILAIGAVVGLAIGSLAIYPMIRGALNPTWFIRTSRLMAARLSFRNRAQVEAVEREEYRPVALKIARILCGCFALLFTLMTLLTLALFLALLIKNV